MYYVYILSNWDDSVLYIGITSDLMRRLYEHRNHLVDGFPLDTMCISLCILNTQAMSEVLSNEKNNSKDGAGQRKTL